MSIVTPDGSCVARNGQSEPADDVAVPFDEALPCRLHIRPCGAAPTDGADAPVDGDPEGVLRAFTPVDVFPSVARSSHLAKVGSTWPR